MDIPARRDDEDTRKLALAPEDGVRFLHHQDGTWGLVGDDGWEVSAEDLDANVRAAIAAVRFDLIDVEPISVRDNEI
ncbi:hypothetical protein GFY24_05590 [Nocardia sp. SYP-A9097]|uniref:hypothetical protein n=1 Tax=Nocardia sp. SYP-A9097 TaxID=2663237 RepID=UPI00129A54D0|nr:hypothetical protein [Nocardia sp. SYP-A9097]MRH86942.1 hypothetical protein [Nocardia sp. SYP-A9097]